METTLLIVGDLGGFACQSAGSWNRFAFRILLKRLAVTVFRSADLFVKSSLTRHRECVELSRERFLGVRHWHRFASQIVWNHLGGTVLTGVHPFTA
jgi:hypothetical protein